MAHLNGFQVYSTFVLFVFAIDKLQDMIPLEPNSKSASLFVLNVAILSARENFDKRQTIRDSWLQHIELANQLSLRHGLPFQLKAHFVVGSRPCLVHPMNREDLYGCMANLTLLKYDTFERVVL